MRPGWRSLKLSAIEDDRPVKLTVKLPAAVHRDLVAYAKVLSGEIGQAVAEPAKLIGPILSRFMATDRAFAKLRRTKPTVPRRQPAISDSIEKMA